jgi:hypothetical protein
LPLKDERLARRDFSRTKNSDSKKALFFLLLFLFAKEHASYAAAHALEKEKVNLKKLG